MATNLRETAAQLSAAADYQQGLESLVGFLLAQLERMPGYSPQALLDALQEEQRWRLEADALPEMSPLRRPLPEALLWPFQRLDIQLRARLGGGGQPALLPKPLLARYPRLDGAPATRFAVVSASPGGTPTAK